MLCESLLGKGGRKNYSPLRTFFWLTSILPMIEILKNELKLMLKIKEK
jgi:hypothetical protein